jgi:hypothetical protein
MKLANLERPVKTLEDGAQIGFQSLGFETMCVPDVPDAREFADRVINQGSRAGLGTKAGLGSK